MKRILFITAFVPSSLAAAEKFTLGFINELSKGNIVDLVYFKYKWNDDYVVPNINVHELIKCSNSTFVKLINVCLYPIIHPQFSVRFNWIVLFKLRKLLKKNNYDIVVLDHSQTFLYGKFLNKIPKLLIAHDVILQRVSRTSNYIITLISKLSENFVLTSKNSKVFTFSSKDADILRVNYNIDAGITSCHIDEEILKVVPEKIENTIVFIGKWERNDNSDGLYWFLKEVYPLLSSDYIVKIIGIGLSEKIVDVISKCCNVEYLGFVDNPYKLISNAKLVASPLFTGAGVKVKVVEALACGTPVIGTPIAFEGIPSVYSEFMIEAQSARDFANKIFNVDFTLEKRKEMKSYFIETYISKSILSYVQNFLRNNVNS